MSSENLVRLYYHLFGVSSERVYTVCGWQLRSPNSPHMAHTRHKACQKQAPPPHCFIASPCPIPHWALSLERDWDAYQGAGLRCGPIMGGVEVWTWGVYIGSIDRYLVRTKPRAFPVVQCSRGTTVSGSRG